jgi:predicted nucleotidyltransferase
MIKKQVKCSVDRLKQCLLQIPELELAILIGSQASGKAHLNSDWDIAIRWHRQPQFNIITVLAQTETLRRTLARRLEVTEDKIDLIDLTHARLTMRAVVVEEGLILKGENTLAWHYFLQRTWRELEEFYWNQCYAA